MSIPVGELVILRNADYHTEWNGQLGVVTGALNWHHALDRITMTYEWTWGYEVQPLCPGTTLLTSRPDQIRRLRGPDDSEEGALGAGEGLEGITSSAFVPGHEESV